MQNKLRPAHPVRELRTKVGDTSGRTIDFRRQFSNGILHTAHSRTRIRYAMSETRTLRMHRATPQAAPRIRRATSGERSHSSALSHIYQFIGIPNDIEGQNIQQTVRLDQRQWIRKSVGRLHRSTQYSITWTQMVICCAAVTHTRMPV